MVSSTHLLLICIISSILIDSVNAAAAKKAKPEKVKPKSEKSPAKKGDKKPGTEPQKWDNDTLPSDSDPFKSSEKPVSEKEKKAILEKLKKIKINWIPVNETVPLEEIDPEEIKMVPGLEKKIGEFKKMSSKNNTSIQSRFLSLSHLFSLGNTVFGVIKKFEDAGGFLSLLKQVGLQILKIFGITNDKHAILVDKICEDCRLFVRCTRLLETTGWHEVDGEGWIIKFKPNFLWSSVPTWYCEYENKVNSKYVGITTLGHKSKYSLYEIRPRVVEQMYYNTDVVEAAHRWLCNEVQRCRNSTDLLASGLC